MFIFIYYYYLFFYIFMLTSYKRAVNHFSICHRKIAIRLKWGGGHKNYHLYLNNNFFLGGGCKITRTTPTPAATDSLGFIRVNHIQ